MHRILGTGVPSWDSSEGEPLDYKQVRGHFQTFWWVGLMMVVLYNNAINGLYQSRKE
jgi:hypothetical protein